MAKDDTLKKPKKMDVNRIMIFISSILIPFLWIDLYLVLKNTSKLMVVRKKPIWMNRQKNCCVQEKPII